MELPLPQLYCCAFGFSGRALDDPIFDGDQFRWRVVVSP